MLFDCLEFDDHLRYVDVIDDAAFLAMDLEFLGRRDLAALFLRSYALVSGDDAKAAAGLEVTGCWASSQRWGEDFHHRSYRVTVRTGAGVHRLSR